MSYGIRTPNIKKRIKARTTGKIKRQIKKSVNPLYGKKGVGFVKNPQKSINDPIYHKTTVGIGTGSSRPSSQNNASSNNSTPSSQQPSQKDFSFRDMVVTVGSGFFRIVFGIIGLILSLYALGTGHILIFIFLFAITSALLATGLYDYYKYRNGE